MLRRAVLQARWGAARPFLRPHNTSTRIGRLNLLAPSSIPSLRIPAFTIRRYSAPAELTRQEVEGRIMDLLKNFDKVKDPSKITPTSHFSNDLGLDSLDTVEVVMAVEEEFSIEIPDKEADAILSLDKAVDYILKQPDAH